MVPTPLSTLGPWGISEPRAQPSWLILQRWAGLRSHVGSSPVAATLGLFKKEFLPTSVGKRTKKGMATAKQRLGKILKIHRNGKLLL